MIAMILAAGRGERMRPLTDTCPKPLLVVQGKPLIVWHIQNLVAAGIVDIVINHAHLGHMIEDKLGDGNHLGARIRYSRETTALETAGGIATALPLLGTKPFLVINGDIFCPHFDFTQMSLMTQQMLQQQRLAWLWMVPNPAHHPDGDFVLDEQRISQHGMAKYTFSGIGLYQAALFQTLTPGQPAKLAPLLINSMNQGKVGGSLYLGKWTDVGTPERLKALNQYL